MKRRYELKERARRQAETRRRIVEAAAGLHASVGPARTTVSAIAERAGVQRHTVYAHFPDDETLFRACSLHWREQHPRPDFTRALAHESPEDRLREALVGLYAWYEQVEPDLVVFIRDAGLVPANADALAAEVAETAALTAAAARGWPRRRLVRAAIAHAFEFETWRSLVRGQGLSREQAAEAMLRFARSAAQDSAAA